MRRLLAIALGVAVPLILLADVVELTTGEKLEGEIVARDEEGITLKVPYGKIIIENEFIKSVEEDKEPGPDKKTPPGMDKNANDAQSEAKKLKWRLERWMKSRNKIICKKCGGDGKDKCKYCKGSGLQFSDPVNKTTRGCIPCRGKGVLGECKGCKATGFYQKYFKFCFWEIRTKKFRLETTRTAGKVDDYIKKIAAELRSGSHENSSWIKPYQTFKVDDVKVDGVWGTTTASVTYDAATGSSSTEEVRWKKVGSEWWLASPCDEDGDE